MKKLFALAFVSLFLTACGQTTPLPTEEDHAEDHPTEHSHETTKPSITTVDGSITASEVITVLEGEVCGGEANTKCESPLFCKKDVETPGTAGICIDTVVDAELVCSAEQKPVCGRVEDRKNTYLNECEARRHGASVLNQGFCGRQNSFEKPCEAEVLSVGVCEKYWRGFSFDGATCQEKLVMGCDIDTPFETEEACNSTCG